MLQGDSASLENITTTTLDDGALCYVAETHSHYELHRDSVASPSPPAIIAPIAGPGRWVPAGSGSGAQGAQGFQGATGTAGSTGAQGSQGSQGSPGSGTPSLLQQPLLTTSALGALDVTGFADGTAAQVAGFDSFVLDRSPPAGSTADGVNLITATGGGGALWVRQFNQPATDQFFSSIFVNSSSGSDSARDPQNSGTPLKTIQEAFTRLGRLGLIQSDITIHYTGTGQSFDADLTGAIPAGSPVTITVLGPITVLATQTITTFQAPVPASNTRGAITFPAPGYAANEPLRFTGNTGNAIAFVTLHPSANVDNVTHFFSLTGTVDDPANGNDVEHISMPSTLGNVSVRTPAGIKIVIQNCVVTGHQVSQGDNGCLVFNQCQIPNGDTGYGPVAFQSSLVGGIDTQNIGATTIGREARVCQSCFWTNGISIANCSNTIFVGSNTSIATMAITDSIVNCEVGPSGTADFSIWGLSSTASAILVQGALLDLGFTTVWGANPGGVNQTFDVQAGGQVLVASTAIPTATGPTNAWRLGSNRLGSFAQLPVSCPQVPCGFTFDDTKSGVAGQSLELTAQTGNIGAVSFFATNPVKGLYQVSAYVSPTVAGTTGALNVNATWTDKTGVVQTKVICTYADISSLVHGEGGVIVIEANGASAVQYSVTGVTTAGALSYALRLTCLLLSSG